MVKFVPLIFSILALGVFAFAFLTGSIMFQTQNNISTGLANDTAVSEFYGNITQTLASFSSDANTANTAFNQSSVTVTGITPFVNAVTGIWRIMKAAPVVLYNLTAGLIFGKIVGSTAGFIIAGVLAGILIIMVISAVILFITRGEGG